MPATAPDYIAISRATGYAHRHYGVTGRPKSLRQWLKLRTYQMQRAWMMHMLNRTEGIILTIFLLFCFLVSANALRRTIHYWSGLDLYSLSWTD